MSRRAKGRERKRDVEDDVDETGASANKKKLTDDVDPGAERLRHRLVLVGLEALDDDLLIRREEESVRERDRERGRRNQSAPSPLCSSSTSTSTTSQSIGSIRLRSLPHLLDVHRCFCSLRPRNCLGETSRDEAGGQRGSRGREASKKRGEGREKETTLFFLCVDA